MHSAIVAHSCVAVYSKCKRLNRKCTHSSLVRSCVSFTRSLKHPNEYMLSKTSGSNSVRDRILFKHTRRGGGCSGHGSLRPPLMGKSITLSAAVTLIITNKRAEKDMKCGAFKSKIWKSSYLHKARENWNTYWYHGCFCISSNCKQQRQKMALLHNITVTKISLLANLSNPRALELNLLVFV